MTLLEKLAPYLPYKLKLWDFEKSKTKIMHCTQVSLPGVEPERYKPILRPLSDLSNNYMESWHEILDEFSPREYSSFEERFNSFLNPLSKFDFLTVSQYQVLIKNHFDLFGMIESGEAIDINTLK